MYRQYENPRELQKELDEKKKYLDKLNKILKESKLNPLQAYEMEDRRNNLQDEISELVERVNFAWQDEEYEEDMRIAERIQYGSNTLEEEMQKNGVSWKDFF